MKSENDTLLIVGGLVAAFAAYEFFIKPKTHPVTSIVPVGAGTAVTQARLPAATATSPVASIAQTLANLLKPAPQQTAAQQAVAQTAANNATDAALSDEYFSPTPIAPASNIFTPSAPYMYQPPATISPTLFTDNSNQYQNLLADGNNMSSDDLEQLYFGDLGAVDRRSLDYFDV